jgi:Invasion associated locus B (IalB) protein
MRRWVAILLVLASPAAGRDALGIYDGWGAFRDARPHRCFAIAKPERRSKGKWQAFASVAHWPQQRIRGQLHLRLSRERLAKTGVTLRVGERRFPLVAGSVDAWAPSTQLDAAIIAAMRSAESMSVSAVSAGGSPFFDLYRLKGAATAIDAAALGCARGR